MWPTKAKKSSDKITITKLCELHPNKCHVCTSSLAITLSCAAVTLIMDRLTVSCGTLFSDIKNKFLWQSQHWIYTSLAFIIFSSLLGPLEKKIGYIRAKKKKKKKHFPEDIRVWKAQVSSLLSIGWCISKINYNINLFIHFLTWKKSLLHRKESQKKITL